MPLSDQTVSSLGCPAPASRGLAQSIQKHEPIVNLVPTDENAAHHQAIPASQQLAGVRERHRTQESNRRRSASARLRRERHIDFGVAAGSRGRDGSGNAIRMLAQQRPPRAACDNYERDSACAQVLLVADTAVGGEQEVEAGLFCCT